MMSAKECKAATLAAEEQQRKYYEERLREIREKTLEFCNGEMSEKLKAASNSGKHELILDFFSAGLYNAYKLIKKNGSYWSTESYTYLDLSTIKEMAEMHGFTVESDKHAYMKNARSYETGRYIKISW